MTRYKVIIHGELEKFEFEYEDMEQAFDFAKHMMEHSTFLMHLEVQEIPAHRKL